MLLWQIAVLCLKAYFYYKLSFMTYSQTVSTPSIRFFKLTYGAA